MVVNERPGTCVSTMRIKFYNISFFKIIIIIWENFMC